MLVLSPQSFVPATVTGDVGSPMEVTAHTFVNSSERNIYSGLKTKVEVSQLETLWLSGSPNMLKLHRSNTKQPAIRACLMFWE